MPSVYRRRVSPPPPRQPFEDALWARLDETRLAENGEELLRQIALVQLRRARLQAGLTARKGPPHDKN